MKVASIHSDGTVTLSGVTAQGAASLARLMTRGASVDVSTRPAAGKLTPEQRRIERGWPEPGTVFDLTDDHRRLFRHQVFGMSEFCFGAAAVDPKRPYGNSDVLGDLCRILGLTTEEDEWGEHTMTEADEQYAVQRHREMVYVMQIVRDTERLALGRYVYDRGWKQTADRQDG